MKGSKFIVVLPSSLVRSFFEPTIANITNCLRDMKGDELLGDLRYVFLVGGFSSSPLIQAAARAELELEGCAMIAALRPDVAIVRGAVLFANNAKVFTSRKARLTYGVVVNMDYDRRDPEHVRRRSTSFRSFGKAKMIPIFSHHINVGEDIPQDGVCPVQVYYPNSPWQLEARVDILASHKKDIAFPDEDSTFPIGNVLVPLDMDMAASYHDRGVKVGPVTGQQRLQCSSFKTNASFHFLQCAASTLVLRRLLWGGLLYFNPPPFLLHDHSCRGDLWFGSEQVLDPEINFA